MKVTILSRGLTVTSTRLLESALSARGHQVSVVSPVDVELLLMGEQLKVLHRTKEIEPSDVIIPRIAQSVTQYGLMVLEHFSMLGSLSLNSPRGIARSRNPMRCLQHLAFHGVRVPNTVMIRDANELGVVVEKVGGLPVVVRLSRGNEPQGLMVCESLQSLQAALQAVVGLGYNLVVQKYVRSGPNDVRIIVVGGVPLVAIRRTPKVGKLSKSLSFGAKLEACQASLSMLELAARAATLLELEIAAVDLLNVSDGPQVFDVNCSPMLSSVKEVTGVDVAQAISERAERLFAERKS